MRKLIALPFRLLGQLFIFIANVIAPLMRLIVGAILVLVSLAALVGILSAFGFLLSGQSWMQSDIPLQVLLPNPLHWLVLAGATTAIIIPMTFVLIGGLSLLLKKALVRSTAVLGALGVWFIALILTGFGIASAVGNYQQFVASSPDYQEVTQSLPLTESFENISVNDGLYVDVVQSTSTSLSANGRAKNISSIQAHVDNGTLIIDQLPKVEHFCLFCFHQNPRLTLRVVSLSNISLDNGSTIRSDKFSSTGQMHFTLEHGSYSNFAIYATDLKVNVEHGSTASFKGTAANLAAELDHGSDLRAQYLDATSAIVAADHGSSTFVSALSTLNAKADHGSSIMYSGNATLTQSATNGSTVEPLQAPMAPEAPIAPGM